MMASIKDTLNSIAAGCDERGITVRREIIYDIRAWERVTIAVYLKIRFIANDRQLGLYAGSMT